MSLAPLPQQRLPDSKIKSELKESEMERNGLHQLAEAAVSKISKEPVALTKESKIYQETSTNLSKSKEKAYDFSSDSEESITEFEETGEFLCVSIHHYYHHHCCPSSSSSSSSMVAMLFIVDVVLNEVF